MKTNIKNIIFDYGGTLDTNGIHWSEKFWEVYQNFNLHLEKEDFRKAFVYSERKIVEIINSDYGIEQTYKTQLHYQFQYLENNNLLSAFAYIVIDDIVQYCINQIKDNIEITKLTLAMLDQEYNLGLVSNYYGNVVTILKEIDLHKYFNAIIDSSVVGIRKPDKKIFEIALNKLNGKPEETIVVGDSYKNDILPAKELGCITVWLKGKGWNNHDNTDKADIVIASLKDLKNVLNRIEIKN